MNPSGIVIANPEAGSIKDVWEELQRVAAEYQLEVWEITPESSISKMIRIAEERGLHSIMAAGGDGTLHAVANSLQSFRPQVTVGLIPVGTGNDFARALWDGRVPDIREACALVRGPRVVPIDLVECRYGDNRVEWCVNAAVAGFGTVVDSKVSSSDKAALGPLAYLWGATKALPELQAYDFTIHTEQGEFETRAINVVVANGQFIAGGKPIAPLAELTDGLVDLLIFPDLPIADLIVASAQMLAGAHVDNPDVHLLRVKSVELRTRQETSFNLDGEIRGTLPVSFSVIQGALRMFVPERREEGVV